ncbi:hypothetical protein LOTGIDRAFT_173412 [Lottia gigantea]|uniref:RING-type domain-containing protein n=1 Tax=Lottia gigantea TaxID=225164 RepID=V4B1I9_LOTGI|nr:hypothetical protein LOTGIDRAFT_173412 [Lottia gigantea]ESP00177.1 hypothetical protein LOTGIDRAFT_173412 [Lottia gigantea]
MALAFVLYAWEFLVELYGCVCAFFVLLWRILVLLYKVICLIFTGLETLAVVLWTGSYVTVKTLKQSVVDIYDYCDMTWNHAVQMIEDFTNSIFAFFFSIGSTFIVSLQDGVSFGIQGVSLTYNSVINCAVGVQNFILNFLNNIIYFYTSYLPSLGKETYLGILICGLLYLGVFKLICYLNHRGMILFTRQRNHVNSLMTTPLDSDDDILINDQYDSEGTDSSQFQDGTDISDNDSDAMTEHTIDDNDDEDSEVSLNSQTFSSSEDEEDIEVELPAPHYGLRNRSMTPKRSKRLSPDDYEREIEKEKDKRKCVVCQDKSKCVLILPCRHMCLCVDCANQIVRSRYVERRVCPLCRQKIQKVMNVYT